MSRSRQNSKPISESYERPTGLSTHSFHKPMLGNRVFSKTFLSSLYNSLSKA
jgi:hypothetical protein